MLLTGIGVFSILAQLQVLYMSAWRSIIAEKPSPMVVNSLVFWPQYFATDSQSFNFELVLQKIKDICSSGSDMLEIVDGLCFYEVGSELEQMYINWMDKLLSAAQNFLKASDIDCEICLTSSSVLLMQKALEVGVSTIHDLGVWRNGDTLKLAQIYKPKIVLGMWPKLSTMSKTLEYELYENSIKNISALVAKFKKLGIANLAIDVGLGLSTLNDENQRLLKALAEFKEFGLPTIVGLPAQIEFATNSFEKSHSEQLTTILTALSNGASFIRLEENHKFANVINLARSMHKISA
jgi:Pterin binding enzyme